MPSGFEASGLQKGRFMIDRKAFRSLSSGLYLITAKAGDMRCGCVVNTLVQVASEPATLSVSLNKENATTAAILESGRFAATVLAEDAPMELIGTFGFHTSADTDKFAACASAVDGAEVPYVTEHGLARFSVSVTETIDVGSHYLFVGVVEEAEVLSAGDPLTYAYYHAVKGGKTPPRPPPTTTATRPRFPGSPRRPLARPRLARRSPGAAPSAATSRRATRTACRATCAPSAALPARCSSAWNCSSGPRAEKAPATSIAGGFRLLKILRRAYSVPSRQSSKPSMTSAWARSTSGRCLAAASYSPAYSASETSAAHS